jgi:uncharacterized protein RhaS with RHS repeats
LASTLISGYVGCALYNYFRDYDAVTGRFIQSDPIGLDGGLNTYLYANANPLPYADPLGLETGAAFRAINRYDSGPRGEAAGCDTTCEPSDQVSFRIESTPCQMGDAMCGIALRNAGFAPPY